MNILIVGAGVIGTVYGAHLGGAGHTITVLEHPPRTDHIARNGLTARDVTDGHRTSADATVVTVADADQYDLVLVAVRSDQLPAACDLLHTLTGRPLVLLFGNNPAGRDAIPVGIAGDIRLGFPGVGGVIRDDVADYVQIRQQPTALQTGDDPRLDELARTLRGCGFAVQRVADMDGWLTYHAAFVACVAAALYRCGTVPARLADDRRTLALMCAAITEAFTALRRSGVGGLPRNLKILHHPLLRPIAVRYWAKVMRGPTGELYFGAHSRHAQPEMRGIADQISQRLTDTTGCGHLHQLLEPVS